ncbi:hypothetical protein AGMMS50255_2950 [Spirochaetia bacterium]|nr:hypothetical protein AGMMS50255_2950 [Spirochaetia bacterium]
MFKNKPSFFTIMGLAVSILLLTLIGCPTDSPSSPPPPTYTVSYNANGGTGSAPSPSAYTAGATVTVASKGGLSRTGYIFAGWNIKDDGSSSSYIAGGTFSMGTTAITLYAEWEPEPNTDPSKTFNVRRADNGVWYTLTVRKLAEGGHCTIYADETLGIKAAAALAIATQYDNNIYSQITDAFGGIEYMPNNNGKVIFLLLDILDGYDGSGGYVAGYFDPTHMLRTGTDSRSNEAAMLFMDTNPGFDSGSSSKMQNFYSTMAHELQHLIEYSETTAKSKDEKDLWINEGLSTAAEYLYGTGTGAPAQQTSRIDYFNAGLDSNGNPQTTIPFGNNFFVWNGYWEKPENGGDVLADYATAYLFFQWLRIHASNGIGIYKDIIASSYGDYRAVTGPASSKIDSSLSTWENLLRHWLLANRVKDLTGLLGYKNEITPITYSLTGGSMKLSPGEGVFSRISGGSVTAGSSVSSPNIKYVGIGAGLDQSGPNYSGTYLLTFNANSNKDGADENGKIAASVVSGRQVSVQMSLNGNAAPAVSAPLPTTYPIDVHFGPDGKLSPDSPPVGTGKLGKGISVKSLGIRK